MSESQPPTQTKHDGTMSQAVRLRLLSAVVALVAGTAALVVAILLVKSTLA